ncbi:MAG: type I secretion system permease/ATPase [Rhodoferax sp.]|nr:type I secretion system permease/ATPase [Rhodoferax sp.]
MSVGKPVSELGRVVSEFRPVFVRSAVFTAVASLLVLMPSWYMLEVYDRVVNSRSHLTLAMLTLLVLMSYVVMEVLEWARSEMLFDASTGFESRLAQRVFRLMFQANLRRMPGGNLQPMTDLRTIRDFMHSPAVVAVMEAPVSLVFLALIFAIHPLLGWVATGAAVLQVLVGWLNERGTQPPLLQANRMAMAAQQMADGALRNAQVIEAMGMLQNVRRGWLQRQREFLGLQAVASDRAGGFQAVSKFLQNTVGSALLGLSCWLLLHNQLHGGAAMLIVSGILGGRVLAPLVQVVTQWRSVVNARDAWMRLGSLLSQVPEGVSTMALPPPAGHLMVEALVAGAPGQPQAILKGVSFGLAAGEALAVVGPSAAGKTTLARMLVGLWPAISGKVRLDGADVFGWNKEELGPRVGYLPQGVDLFEGTVAENIARFGDVDRDRVQAAAQMVGLHDLIEALPQGYETQIGPDGAVLSGGQRQRVALARALYGDPVLVVLDEPNSSLDEAGDAALSRALQQLKARGATLVVMTHRMSVLAAVDKMLLLRDGQAQAFGPRDEVLAAISKANQSAQARPQGAAA